MENTEWKTLSRNIGSMSKEKLMEEPLMEYIFLISYSCDPNSAYTEFDEEGNLTTPFYSDWPVIFAKRYSENHILGVRMQSTYMKCTELHKMLDNLTLADVAPIDKNKFWYLCLFISDFANNAAIDTTKSIREYLNDLKNIMDNADYSTASLTFSPRERA